MATRKKTFNAKKQVRALARERVGAVPSTRPMEPKSRRKKPKHKKQAAEGEDDSDWSPR